MLIGLEKISAGTGCAAKAQSMAISALPHSFRIAAHIIAAKVWWLRGEPGRRE